VYGSEIDQSCTSTVTWPIPSQNGHGL